MAELENKLSGDKNNNLFLGEAKKSKKQLHNCVVSEVAL